MSFAHSHIFAKINQVFDIYCDLTPPFSEKKGLIYSTQDLQASGQEENVGILQEPLILSIV